MKINFEIWMASTLVGLVGLFFESWKCIRMVVVSDEVVLIDIDQIQRVKIVKIPWNYSGFWYFLFLL